jgi:IS605 OrfB family transposase
VSNSLLLNETCKFKLDPTEEQKQILVELFSTYRCMVKECLESAMSMKITSRKRLHESVYRELRMEYKDYPSHYIYTAITTALGIYKSYRRLSRKRNNINPPSIEELRTILLDDTHLFWFSWESLRIATHKGHLTIPFRLHRHSEKFKGWQVKGSRIIALGDEYYLHVTFKKAVEEKEYEGILGIVTDIRKRIKYGKRMNRRLHSIPFRKIQSTTSYKSVERGYKPETVEAKNTSKTCPICGELNKPNGHVFNCRRCGLQADKHLVAAWNIAAKHPMCRPPPLAAKAIDEALKAEMERVVIKC